MGLGWHLDARQHTVEAPIPYSTTCSQKEPDPYLPDAHDHSISPGADGYALWLHIQFHDSLSTVGERKALLPCARGSAQVFNIQALQNHTHSHTGGDPTATYTEGAICYNMESGEKKKDTLLCGSGHQL